MQIPEGPDNSKEEAEEGADGAARGFDESNVDDTMANVNPMFVMASKKSRNAEGVYAESGPS